jgi:RNA polymerase sigma-70 factor (ECF subfamily)
VISADFHDRMEQATYARPSRPASHARIARQFATACCCSDTTTLEHMLAPDAIAVTDGGGKVSAPLRPVRGAQDVAQLVATLLGPQADAVLAVDHVNGRAGLVLRRPSEVLAIATLSISGTRVHVVWIVLNPDKLRLWQQT